MHTYHLLLYIQSRIVICVNNYVRNTHINRQFARGCQESDSQTRANALLVLLVNSLMLLSMNEFIILPNNVSVMKLQKLFSARAPLSEWLNKGFSLEWASNLLQLLEASGSAVRLVQSIRYSVVS